MHVTQAWAILTDYTSGDKKAALEALNTQLGIVGYEIRPTATASHHVQDEPTSEPEPATRETGGDGGMTPVGTRADGTTITAADVTDHPETAFYTLSGAASLTSTGQSILNILQKSESTDGVIRTQADVERAKSKLRQSI